MLYPQTCEISCAPTFSVVDSGLQVSRDWEMTLYNRLLLKFYSLNNNFVNKPLIHQIANNDRKAGNVARVLVIVIGIEQLH